jgi:hypothetical protein
MPFILPAVLWLLFLAPLAFAQPQPGCSAPEHRQFNFWLGEWDVKLASGKEAGRNRIVAMHDGCALFEDWRGNGGYTGSSLTLYDRDAKRWHQTWVDNTGGLLQLDGSFADGSMTLSGVSIEEGPPRKKTLQRVRWTPQPDGGLRQLWEASENEGKDWKVVFDGWYTRRTAAR